jgi:hypothetical protein
VVYEIIVVPADTPYTTPPEETVATDVLLLLQVPPEVASESVVYPPGAHVLIVPVMGATYEDPVTVTVFKAPHPLTE